MTKPENNTTDWLYHCNKKFAKTPPEIFHIGYHKTGTTFLQRDVIFLFLDALVFTSESICGDTLNDDLSAAQTLSKLNKNAKIAITVRAQTSIFPSYYFLYIKGGGTLAFDAYVSECIRNKKCDFYKMIQSFTKHFPEENIRVFFFEDMMKDEQKFVEDFAAFCQGKAGSAAIPYKKNNRNQSPSAISVEYVRLLNILGRKCGIKGIGKFANKTRGYVQKLTGFSKKKVKDKLTKELEQEICEAYKNSNRRLAEFTERNLEEIGWKL